MGVTVFHSLTATTPDNTQYEIKPSNWNSNHVVSLSLLGSDISNAFTNSPTVTFGTDTNGYISGSVFTNYAATNITTNAIALSNSSLFQQTSATSAITSAAFASANSSLLIATSNSSLFQQTSATSAITSNAFATSNSSLLVATSNSSLFQQTSATSAITSAAFPSAQTTKFAGTGTTYAGTNVSATIGLNSNGLNLALSAGAGGGGSFSAGISTGGNTAGNTGTVSNQIVFVGGNNVTLSGSTAAGGATVTISGPNIGGAQTGISGVAVSNTTYTSGTFSFRDGNNISFASGTGQGVSITHNLQSAGAYLTTAAQSNQVVNSLNGSTGQISLNVGSSLSASTLGSAITFGLASNITTALQSTGNYLTTAMQSQSSSVFAKTGFTSATTAGTAIVATHDTNGLSMGIPAYITTYAAQTAQTANLYATGANTTQLSSTAGVDLRSISISGAGAASAGVSGGVILVSAPPVSVLSGLGNITVGTTGSTIGISGGGGGGGSFSAGISTGGNTSGNTGTVSNQIVFVGGNNVTLSGSTGAGGATVTISGANIGGAQTGISGVAVSNTTYTSGTFSFRDGNNISFASGTGQGVSITHNLQSAGAYLTTAAQSNQVVNSLNGSTGQISLNIGSSLSASTLGSGITFGLASNITTALQSAGAYLTTAAQSSASNVSQVIVGTAAAGGTATLTGGVSFSNANGISFYSSAGNAVVASYTVPTVPTAYVSSVNGSSGAISLNVGSSLSASTNGSSITFGLASNITTALQSAGAYLTTAAQSSASNVSVAIAATNNTGGGTGSLSGGVSFSNANGLTFYTSAGNAIVGSYTVPTVPTAYVSSVNGSSGAISLNVGSSLSASTLGSAITFGLASNITTALQSAGAYLTTAMQSQSSSVFAKTGFTSATTAGTAIVATHDTNGLSMGIPAYITTYAAQTAQTANLYATGANTTQLSSTAGVDLRSISISGAGAASAGVSGGIILVSAPPVSVLSGLGNITVGTTGSTIGISGGGGGGGVFSAGISTGGNTSGNTGTVSNQIVFVGGNNVTLSGSTAAGGATVTISGANIGGAQTGISGVAVSNTTYTSGTFSFRDGNNISFASGTGQGVSITHNLQSAGAYLTTAAQSSASNVSLAIAATNNAGGGTASLSGGVSFSNANGLTFYTSAGNAIVASYTVPTVPTAYVSSVNGSSGAISLNVGSSLSASTNGSSITFGLASNITTALQSAGAYLTTAAQSSASNVSQVIVGTAAAGGTATLTGGVSFSNANGISFYSSAGNAVVASYTVPTVPTAYVSSVNGSSGAISLNVGSSLSASTNGSSITFGLASNITTALQSAGAYLTTAAQSSASNVSLVIAGTASNGGTASLSGGVSFSNANGISFFTSAGNAIVATVKTDYLTTAMQSQSSSVFAKTGFTSATTAGTAIVATHDTNGLSMGIPAYITTAPSTAGLISAINVSAGTTSNNLSAITFANTGNVTFGMAGSVITASAPSGGGGGVAIAASNSTFTSGTVVMSAAGGALTISNGAQSVLLSVPQTSSIVAASGVSLSTNGSTIYLYNDFHDFFSAGVVGNTATYTNSNNSVLAFLPLYPVDNYSFTAFEQLAYWLWTSVANASYAASQTLRYGLYKMDTANNSQLTLVNSSSMFVHASANSNLSGAYTVNFDNSATSFSASSAGTGILSAVAGRSMVLRLPFAGSMQAGEVYALGLHYSYTQTNANTNSRPFYQWGNVANVFTSGQGLGFIGPSTVDGGATTAQLENQGWIYSASTGAFPNTISTNESRANASGFAPQIIFKNIQ